MTVKYDNSGILFKNDRKDPTDERDRDYQGSITVDGAEFWLSGWIKNGQKGKFLSLRVKPKEPKPEASTKPIADELNDEIPF